jgi:hypothetical protein
VEVSYTSEDFLFARMPASLRVLFYSIKHWLLLTQAQHSYLKWKADTDHLLNDPLPALSSLALLNRGVYGPYTFILLPPLSILLCLS